MTTERLYPSPQDVHHNDSGQPIGSGDLMSSADSVADAHSGPRPPPDKPRRRRASRATVALVILAVIYTLAIARSLIMPLVLAILLSLVLAPLVRRLHNWHVPRTLAAGLVVLGLLGLIGYGFSILGGPANEWMDKAPSILREIERDILPLKKTVEEVSRTAEEVDRITSVGEAATIAVPTEKNSFRNLLYSNAQGLLTGTVITVFTLYFLLAWGRLVLRRVGDLLNYHRSQNRFVHLAYILEHELSRYLLTITLINIGLGVAVTLVLELFGMPNPLLWGTAASLLNFVPYIGALITAVLLFAAALVSFDGLVTPVMILSSFLILTTLEGQLITPEVLGRSLALNPLLVFVAIVFWFWLWGAVGALMAVPILLAIKIIGDHIESVKPIAAVISRR